MTKFLAPFVLVAYGWQMTAQVWAVGIAIRDVIHAVLLNKKALLPVSSLIQGPYDIRDICLSVPSVVGRKGVEKHVEIKLWPKEMLGLQSSAKALKETLAKVKV